MIREPIHGERFLPLLLTGSLAAYLLIFWYIGKENYAVELARKEELRWERKQDSIRLAEAALLKLPSVEQSLSGEKAEVSNDPSARTDLSPSGSVPTDNPGSSTGNSAPPRSGQDKVVDPGSDSGNLYHVIAGSFSTDVNARRATDGYRHQGFDASLVLRSNPDGSVTRLVSLKSFGSHEDASAFRNEIRKKTRMEAWIYKRQP